jgi:uncharacterized membrane protein SpoIIM required for sporulation
MDRAESFVRSRSRSWDGFAGLVAEVRRTRKVPAGKVVEFARAYRDLAADLSAARAMGCAPEVALRLNRLVAEAHAAVYRRKVRPSTERRRSGLLRALIGLPRAFADNPRTSFLSAAMLFVPAILAYFYVLGDDRRVHEVFPSLEDVIRPSGGAPGRSLNTMPTAFSANLMVHNSMVAMTCLAYGVLLGGGTVWFLLVNGALLGALAAHFHHGGDLVGFCAQILPHGVTEFLGVLASAQAGFLIARAIWAPGEYSRRDALAVRGREAGVLAAATILLMAWSGIVESFVTRSTDDDAVRLVFAGFVAVAVGVWFLLAIRAGPAPEDADPATASARP